MKLDGALAMWHGRNNAALMAASCSSNRVMPFDGPRSRPTD